MQIRNTIIFIVYTVFTVGLSIFLTNPFYEGFILFTWFIVLIGAIKRLLDRFADAKIQHQQTLNYHLDREKKRHDADTLRLKRLVQTLGSGVLLIDPNEIIQIANETFYHTFKLNDLIGQSYHSIKVIEPLYQKINESMTTEHFSRSQVQLDEYVYDLIMTPLLEADTFKGLLVLITDITSLKTAEQFQKQFTADVSHELKTPLSALIGITEILKNQEVDKATQKEFVELIHEEATRLELMIKDLLTISKMDRLDYELKKSQTSVKKLVKDATSLLKKPIEEKGLTLSVNVEDDDILVDRNRIHQVLINLIKNAMAYTDEGSITITGSTEQNEYVFTIEDTGIGIAKIHQPFVFKRFYRIDEARGRDSGGSGLGLSITKNVILKHGGSIDVSSEENKGSIFTIRLPK